MTSKLIVQVAIKKMFDDAHQMTHLDGRFSPHGNFMSDLKNWCERTNKDFEKWKDSTVELFTLRSKYPETEAKHIISFVLDKKAKVLDIE